MPTQLINGEESKKLQLLPFGKKHSIRAMLEMMEPGQLLRISRDDFRWKRKTPNLFCLDIERKTGKKFRTFKERNTRGWVVERVE